MALQEVKETEDRRQTTDDRRQTTDDRRQTDSVYDEFKEARVE
jgi:hypothetical protein